MGNEKETVPPYKRAENFIAQKLREAGWEIVAENYRRVACELDIVASKGSTLIIVEVKFRSNIDKNFDLPGLIPYRKRLALERGARKFLSESTTCWETIRFDLAVVHGLNKKRPDQDPVFDYYIGI